MITRAICPARLAVEHAVTVPGARPRRLFPVLWPLWRLDVETMARGGLIEHFLIRAIAEAGRSSDAELARFLALPHFLVRRCLAQLAAAGHVCHEDGRAALTPLGATSLAAGAAHTPRSGPPPLLVDRFTGKLLPARFHGRRVRILPAPPRPSADGESFLGLFAAAPFRPGSIEDPAATPDGSAYPALDGFRPLRVRAATAGYLPVYLVERAGGAPLAYTAAAHGRDTFLEELCLDVPTVGALVEAEPRAEPQRLWARFLAEIKARTGADGVLSRTGYGGWRATLPPSAFGAPGTSGVPVRMIGSFELRRRQFLQIWCDDAALRERAVLERGIDLACLHDEMDDHARLERQISDLAHALAVPVPSMGRLRRHAMGSRGVIPPMSLT